VTVAREDGEVSTLTDLRLDRETSAAVFDRRGAVDRIEVELPASAITLE